MLLNILRPPPHLILLHGNACWALHTGGTQQGEEAEALFRLISRKQLPAVFVRWNLPRPELAEAQLKDIFARYTRVEPGGLTCLAPLRQLAVEQGVTQAAQAGFIFELLPLLESSGQLGQCYSINVPGREIELPVYSVSDIEKAMIGHVMP